VWVQLLHSSHQSGAATAYYTLFLSPKAEPLNTWSLIFIQEEHRFLFSFVNLSLSYLSGRVYETPREIKKFKEERWCLGVGAMRVYVCGFW
jgi:hypothetical protein